VSELIITPKVKVAQLLETYPQLEAVLVEYAPIFEKLKNPALRRTIARITTLQQAAAVGEVKVEELINRLREEVGQELTTAAISAEYTILQPPWFKEELISATFDAADVLDGGEQPVNQVIADLQQLEGGKIYQLVAPFLPAPLIDKATSLNLEHWVNQDDSGKFNIYFYQSL
jgi:hypothetical protein